MAIAREDVRRLVTTSRAVFRACALPNGAIIAARPDLPDYPATVQSYGFVWIRDAAFVCAAAHRIGLPDIQEPFFRWVAERAERTQQGLLVNAYFPNGVAAGVVLVDAVAPPRDRRTTHTVTLAGQVQIDALGTLLWTLADHRRYAPLTRGSRRLAAEVADSLVDHWSGRTFRLPTWDVWEAFAADPRRGEVHTYSLAMAIRGLEAAGEVLGRRRSRQRAITSMRLALERCYDAKRRTFVRTFGRRTRDLTPDASLLGLVFPAQHVAADDPRCVATVKRILRGCRAPAGGLLRFPSDRYSGRIRAGRLVLDGSGAWPWLSAWAAIVLAEQGRWREGAGALRRVLKLLARGPLPEQVQPVDRPRVAGLAVAHAFAVFAGERLGALPRQRR